MSDTLITRTLDQVGETASLESSDRILMQRGEGPATTIAAEALLAWLADAGLGPVVLRATRAELLAVEPVGVAPRGEVHDDPAGDVPNGNGVYAGIAGAWVWVGPNLALVLATAEQTLQGQGSDLAVSPVNLRTAREADREEVRATVGAGIGGRGGLTPVVRGLDGRALQWVDQRTGLLRSFGDMHTGGQIRRSGWIAPFISQEGAAIGGFGPDGEIYAPAAVDAPIAYPLDVVDGALTRRQAFIADGSAERRLSIFDQPVRAVKVAAPGLVRAVCADGTIRHASYRGRGSEPVDAFLRILLIMGQSLSVGGVDNGAASYLAEPPSSAVLMWQQGVLPAGIAAAAITPASLTTLVPAYEQTLSPNFGETGWASLGWMLNGPAGRAGGSTYHVASFGKGNSAYAALKKGTTPYANAIASLTALKTWCAANGKTPLLEAVIWDHGENDINDTEAAYQAKQLELLTDLTADVVALGGITGAATFNMYVMQRGLFVGGVLSGPSLAQANANAANSRMICVGPQYQFGPYQDLFHPPSATHRQRAAAFARVIRDRNRAFDNPRPLRMLSAEINGLAFSIRFDVSNPPLQLSQRLVDDPGAFGLSFIDSAASPVVVPGSLRVSDDGVRIEGALSGPTDGVRKFRTAWFAGTNTRQGSVAGPRSCIHDSALEACPASGQLLPNFALHQEIIV